jgi:hypothetical protein
LKVWEAPAREVWARMEGMSRRGGVCWQQQRDVIGVHVARCGGAK